MQQKYNFSIPIINKLKANLGMSASNGFTLSSGFIRRLVEDGQRSAENMQQMLSTKKLNKHRSLSD